MARTRMYRNGVLEDENFPVSDISDHLKTDGALVWVDLCAPHAGDLELVVQELGLHELAVEDASVPHQRPKLDRYASHEFLNVYDVRLDEESGELRASELSAFIVSNALVTIRKDDLLDIEQVVQRWDDAADLMKHGVGALVYGLVDYVVDCHFEVVQSLDDQIEELEDLLFAEVPQDSDLQRRSFALRKSLVQLRRVVLPMREVINTMMRRDIKIVTEPLTPYYQDVYDHVLRASEWTESLRDLVTQIMETHITLQGNRLNIITKKVTSWAAIIAVPTAITGFYGQNVPYPGFAKYHGFITSMLLIVVISVGLYISFRRRDWL